MLSDAPSDATRRPARLDTPSRRDTMTTCGPSPAPTLSSRASWPIADARRVVLAGPGVVRDGAIEGLRAFAAAANVGVANTWGAKGVFNWDSPHHLGTVGLQARDFELLGFADHDLIIATGVDRLETRGGFALAPVRHVAPGDLAGLATVVHPCRAADPAERLLHPALRGRAARLRRRQGAAEPGGARSSPSARTCRRAGSSPRRPASRGCGSRARSRRRHWSRARPAAWSCPRRATSDPVAARRARRRA